MMIVLWIRKREMRDDDKDDMEDTSRYEKTGVLVAWLSLEDLVLVILPARSELVPAVLGIVNCLAH